jgi:hypothetical protein
MLLLMRLFRTICFAFLGAFLLTACEPVEKQKWTCVRGHDALEVRWGSPDGTTFVCDEYRPTADTIAPGGFDL